ncbi:peroxisomal ATPase PEX1 [Lepisosteus oculatus]|uniref:peroxisomal ATPase PEX1 n=1 Tax=Lepisosteus oculatus TaxID=7918 RepID=UPI0035F527B6
MLGSHGIQPVTLVFNNAKNCFLHLSSSLVSQLRLQENQALELSWDRCQPVYLSWTKCLQSSFQGESVVEVNRHLGARLGIKDGEQAFLRPCWQILSIQQVFVEPLSSDDWEILELHSSALERHLLDQIRVVYPNGLFPVWVDQHTVIYVRIAALTPAAPYGRLEQLTELIVSPKLRQDGESPARPSAPPNWQADASQARGPHGPDNAPGRDALGTHRGAPPCVSPGGGRNLRSLIRSMFAGSPAPQREVPAVPSVPPVLGDSVFRVSRSAPFPAGRQSPGHGAAHVFPWRHPCAARGGAPFAVTYGRLSGLHRPREPREKPHRTLSQPERKRGPEARGAGDQLGSGGGAAGPLAVRIICHGVEELADTQGCGSRRGMPYGGRVWISESIRRRLGIDFCTAVRIQPLNSVPEIASCVRLQPLQSLPQKVKEQDVQSAFLDWLQAQNNEELPWLTGRSSFVALPVHEENMEFALTVMKPESKKTGNGESDEVFMLTTSLLEKTDIQLSRYPQAAGSESVRAQDPSQILAPPVESLGGVEDIADSAFEHISQSLMGRPLSQELLSVVSGLRNGALLLTGLKGSGKTALATALCRKAADVLDAHVEVIDCQKLRGKRGETVRKKLEEAFEEAAWRQPSVVLLDDLEQLAGAAAGPEQEHGPEALRSQQLAQALKDLVSDAVVHGSLIALIATSQSEHTLHPSLTSAQGSHFFQCIKEIPRPSQAQRSEILRAIIKSKSIIAEDSLGVLDLESVSRETEGYLASDFTLLVERAVHASVLHNRITASEVFLATSDFQQALRSFTPPSLLSSRLNAPPEAGWDRVGGLREVRQVLMDTVQLPAKYPALFASLPIRQRSGVLLYGAPGTGKTLLAGAVAKESGMNFISIKGPELLSKYIGASELAVRDVFQRAQAAKPCILFFDEFDSLAPRRGHDSTGVTDRVVNQLLTQLDGVERLDGVYVLAATSRPDLIDPALLRPGRLDKSLYCPPPDQEARLEILKALTQTVPLAGDVDFDQMAAATDSFTGADLKALLYNAQLEAIHSNLGAGSLHEVGSGSDSDVSLSSMIFLNHSSGSDDSAGEGEGGLEHSMVLLDSSELLPEDPRHNMWRLYFGSSYESELGNPTPSELNSQCLSGPNSMTHDITGASLRDMASSQTPAFMASLQEGFQELSHEQLDRLRAEISSIKANYRSRMMEESFLTQAAPSKAALLICQSHLTGALASTRASVGKQDWKKYHELYDAFRNTCEGRTQGPPTTKPGQRVTLA